MYLHKIKKIEKNIIFVICLSVEGKSDGPVNLDQKEVIAPKKAGNCHRREQHQGTQRSA